MSRARPREEIPQALQALHARRGQIEEIYARLPALCEGAQFVAKRLEAKLRSGLP